nr:immunoglobulin heavy chain variable region {clone cVH1} [Camelus dromedarius=camels, spleen, Peptide Partial, 114 aa] [Camelus dromedarius]
GGSVQAGGSLRLSCAASGYSNCPLTWSWYRQFPGTEREFVSSMDPDGNTKYTYSVKGRFTMSRGSTEYTVFLQMDNLKPEDTAMYYCKTALQPGGYCGYGACLWGQGTQVTVSS